VLLTEKKKNIIMTDKKFPTVSVSSALGGAKCEYMTELQAAVLPPLVSGKDAIVTWEPKSGRTVAYLIVALEKCIKDKSAKALVLVPSSKECINAHILCQTLLTKHPNVTTKTLYGDTAEEVDVSAQVIIATPGPFNNYLTAGNINSKDLKSVRFCVIDEFDVLEEMGLQAVVQSILSNLPLPKDRQLVLFSSKEHEDITKTFKFKNSVEHIISNEGLSNNFKSCNHEYLVAPTEKVLLQLKALLSSLEGKKVIVIFPEVQLSRYFKRLFYWNGCDAADITGSEVQILRDETTKFMACTKGVAFGLAEVISSLKIPNVHAVIWVFPPVSVEDYFAQINKQSRLVPNARSILLIRPFETAFTDQASAERKVKFKQIKLQPADSWDNRLEDRKTAEKVARAYLIWFANYIMGYSKLDKKQVAADFITFCKTLGIKEITMLEKDLRRLGLDGIPRLFRYKETKEEKEGEENAESSDWSD